MFPKGAFSSGFLEKKQQLITFFQKEENTHLKIDSE